MSQTKKYFFAVILVSVWFLFSSTVHASVIFQDNFDNDCSGAACNSGGWVLSYPTGWDGWAADDAQPVTIGGATHYGGEISTPGRDGSGKSLKIWRYNGYYGNYTGSLLKIFSGSNSNFWFRYYIKIPPAWQITGGDGYKQWRFNVTGGGGELYLNVLCPTGDCTSNQTWGLYDNASWTTVFNNSDYAALRDGNWHAVQWNINLSSRTVALYIDSVSKFSGTIANIGGTFQMMQHFPIGNSNAGHIWVSQNSWQAEEIDDLVIATTKAETDPIGTSTTYTVTPSAGSNGTISPNTSQTINSGSTTTFTVTPNSGYTATVGGTCGGSLSGTTYTTNAITANCTVVASFTASIDTTPPTSPTNLAASATSSSSITVSWTASTDNVGVTGYIVERCSGSGCSTFAQVGTPSASPFVDSGLTANTFYNYHVRATDAAGNLSGWSNVVGATTQAATPAPSFTLTANPTSITSGQSSILTWSAVTNATSCTASGGTFTGSKSMSGGTQSVSPTSTTTYTLSCVGTGGATNQSATVTVSGGSSTLFFSEGYEDTNFASRGWYDTTTGTVDTAEHHSGTSSLRCTYNAGGNNCTAPSRHKFTDSNGVYVSYWVKYSSNFVGSGVGYHPHEFYFLTNLNGDYDGLAFDYLAMYLESHWDSSSNGYMQVAFQDGQNIDQTRLNQNLIGVTENRATAGCNGSPSGYTGGCYDRGDGVYVNGTVLSTPQTFTTANKNTWNHVEAYYQLNSISNNVGQPDGILRIWFNDSLVFERTNAILRTGQRPTMKFNQFIFAPWIGDGSPVTQTMWIDDLEVRDSRPSATPTPTPCNTVSPTNFSQSAYNAYGAPFDAFQTGTNLLDAKCNSADTHTINLTTGVTGDTTRIVYTKGYYYDPVTAGWTQYSGTCNGALNGEWCQGSISATITSPNISTASATNPTYLVGMTCSVQNGSWRCGCRDTTCANFYWQVQGAGQ